MDKRSFIRGFGVGVLFTAIILGISFTLRTSDSFVTSRAKELGMVYEDKKEDSGLNLTKATEKPKDTETPKDDEKEDSKNTESTPDVAPTATPKVTPEVTAAPEATAKVTPVPTPKSTPKATKKPKKDTTSNSKPVEKYLTIHVGDWSSDVSEKLESLGIIESAKDFDQYLNQNGYSSSIVAGTFKVSTDDTYEELARTITGR